MKIIEPCIKQSLVLLIASILILMTLCSCGENNNDNDNGNNKAPVVTIISPANGDSFNDGDDITIRANASDSDGSIANVEFFNGSESLGVTTASPYTIIWNDVSSGQYKLSAVAEDNNGESVTSSPVSIDVSGSGLLTITLKTPVDGDVYQTDDLILVEAQVNTGGSVISEVEFFVNGSSIGSDASHPYTVEWKASPSGRHTLTAVVSTDNGETETSDEISVCVGACDKEQLKCTFTMLEESTDNFTGLLVVENPNTSYAWNGTYFDLKSLGFDTTSEIVSASSPDGNINFSPENGSVSMGLGWQSLFPYGKKVEITIKGIKKGDNPSFNNFRPVYVRGKDIEYPVYADLPKQWEKGKETLEISDLILNIDDYYNSEAKPSSDHFIVYNPTHDTQVNIGQVMSMDYPVNTVDNVRIWIPSKYMAMGIAFNYEMFKINPHYMCALGTKENFSAGVVSPEAGNTNNPVTIDGQTWYWPIVNHPDGPFQQETGNFIDCKSFFPDFLLNTEHDDLLAITADPENKNFITAAISSGISLTVTREQLHAVETAEFKKFIETAKDPYSEFSILTFSYNRGFGNFMAKKLLTDNRADALESSDIAADYGLTGFASHVATVQAIMDQMNATTSDIYDARISWEDMTVFFSCLRKFYSNNVPDEDEWNRMLDDVHKGFNLLSNHWEDENISYRYDFVTLLRIAKKYLPGPDVPRPTGEDWYYQITNA